MLETHLLPILALIVLVLLSAFFSSSETALIASGRVKLTHLVAKGNKGASRALRLIRQPTELLAVILVGNNLVNVTAAALATTLMGPIYATLVITLVLLVFAEITPKTLASHRPEQFASRVAMPVQLFGYLFRPLVWVTGGITDLLLWPVLRGRRKHDRRLSRQELLMAIKLGARDGELEPGETRMTEEVLALKDKPVSKIMIPIEDIDAIPESALFRQVMEEFVRSGNTRYPVYRGELSEMIGVLLVKDFLVHSEAMEENWRQYVRPLMRVPGHLEIDELLRDMQIQHSHMAAVEGSDGRIVGLVTMEDVLEEIVGEIQDEYDDEGAMIREYSPDRFAVRGDVEVDDLCKVINVDLGQRDQLTTLSEWFETHAPTGRGKSRRVKVGGSRVIQRSPNRYEIWIRDKTRASEQEAGDDQRG
jgi:CBS domain containing-hemolysin-like protein